ncbi:MAG: SurA N-terminal domain-containing protein [Gammaproteobacteria bacterium]|nr:SurA N-terminal domain-containing protein [Gammaproteobacteria bacterium]
MLQSIRDRTQGWVATVIITLVILSFALWGIHSYISGASNNTTIAKVNGVEIDKSQFAASYERLRRQAQVNLGSNLPASMDAELKQRALQGLIYIQALEQASVADKYRISSRQVGNYLESIPEFQINGKFSLARFNQVLALTSFNVANFLDIIRSTMLVDQPRIGIILSAFALPNEIDQTIALVNQEREMDYVILPRDFFSKQAIVISPDDISAYYKQNQDKFKTPEQVSVEYVELSKKDLAATLHPSEDALKAYYNENINSYTQPMQWSLDKIQIPLAENPSAQALSDAKNKANDMLKKIKAGADFATLSHTVVKQPVWVALNQLPSDLQKTVSSLTKPGDLSSPIQTKTGIVIIKVLAVKPAVTQTYAQAAASVKEALTRQMAEEKFADLREKLANAAYEYPDSLQSAVKITGTPIKVSGLFSLDNGKDIAANEKVREVAYSADVLNSQNNSDVIQVNPDLAIVLRIKTHIPAALMPLKSVEQQISNQLKTQKYEANASAAAFLLKQKLQSGYTIEQAKKEYPAFSWLSVGWVGRYSTKVDPAILDEAFRIPRPVKGANKIFVSVRVPTGYAVVTVNNVRDGNVDPKQGQQEVFADQVQNSEGQLEYKLYEQSIIHHAKIVNYIENKKSDKQIT